MDANISHFPNFDVLFENFELRCLPVAKYGEKVVAGWRVDRSLGKLTHCLNRRFHLLDVDFAPITFRDVLIEAIAVRRR